MPTSSPPKTGHDARSRLARLAEQGLRALGGGEAMGLARVQPGNGVRCKTTVSSFGV